VGSFGEADCVEVLDIYAASDEPIPGITSETLVKAVGRANEVRYAGSMDEALGRLAGVAQEGDVIVTLGAGSVSHAGPLLLERLGG
jgi:UDP-N-acetylmuramate--alanine ligase